MKWIEDLPIDKGKVVLVRVDYNVPIVDGIIVDAARIVASLPTIEYILGRGGIPLLLSHLGRPNGVVDQKYSLQNCVSVLQKLLKVPLIFHRDFQVLSVQKKIAELQFSGGVLLLENLRFFCEEESLSEVDRGIFAKSIAILGDFFVNDAFSVSHREHASVVELPQLLPSAGGFLLKKELCSVQNFKEIQKGTHKTAIILGGSKVNEKLPIIKHLLPHVDRFLLGGAISCTFLHVMGVQVGKSPVSESHVEECIHLLGENREKIILPQDVVVALDFDAQKATSALQIRQVSLEGADFVRREESIVDIGKKTIVMFTEVLNCYEQIFWNGPMGVIENRQTAMGTKSLIEILSARTQQGAQVVIGGGDSLSVLPSLVDTKTVGYCCMGGGALLEYLSGRALPGLRVLG